MNLIQYRELKAQEQVAQATQTPEQTQVATQPVVPTQVATQEPVKEETKIPATPEKIKVDGVGEVTLEELKNGYLRQSDYTKKTQEVSNQRKETQDAIALFEQIKQNPQLAQQLKQAVPLPQSIDPATSKVVELETKLYDVMLQQEIDKLRTEFPDFEVREVLQTAQAKGMTDLRDAYLLTKSSKSPDMESLKAQIRQELEAERLGTQTIITSNAGSTPVSTSIPTITPSEHKVASGMKMSDAEYIKWRDAT